MKQFQQINDTAKRCPVCGFICPLHISEPIVHPDTHTGKVCWNVGGRSKTKSKNYVSIWRRLRFFPQFCFTYTVYFFKWLFKRQPKSTLKLKLTRLSICLACDDFYDEDTESCFACGCYCDDKASMLDQQCPVGKW